MTDEQAAAAKEIARLAQLILALAPTAGLYVGITIKDAPAADRRDAA